MPNPRGWMPRVRVELTSTIANALSIPRLRSIRKKSAAKKLEAGSRESAAGKTMKAKPKLPWVTTWFPKLHERNNSPFV